MHIHPNANVLILDIYHISQYSHLTQMKFKIRSKIHVVAKLERFILGDGGGRRLWKGDK